jgi:His/Glu/Gln/Arg/opine family amino acid ABC transporter permease subunit
MSYQFNFSAISEYGDVLASGIAETLCLTFIGSVLGLCLGIIGGVSRAWSIKPLQQFFTVYVEIIRNTPFLVQLFFIFFGLPAMGFRLTDWEASILAMVINLGAYLTEIIRAGIESTPKGQIEAAASLAMTRAQIFWHVVLPPSLLKVWPSICSQVIIVMLGSSVCSQIGTEELTYAANYIQSRNFRAFETYFVVAGIYFVLAMLVRRLMIFVGGRYLGARKR